MIFDLAKEKPWLREECGWILYCCINDLVSSKSGVKFVEATLDHLCSSGLARTPEGVSIWLAAKDAFPHAKFPRDIWKHDDPLDSREKRGIAKAMKESFAPDDEAPKEGRKVKLSGVWTSKLHFAWDAILARIYDLQPVKEQPKAKSKPSRLSFVDFWIEVVDNGLFAAAASEERKYWGFQLFFKVLDQAPQDLVSFVFTKNLVRCLINQLANEDRYLHRMAVKAAKSIQARVSKEPEFAAAAVNGLMGPTGSINFDQVTKTKTIDKIVTEANPEALKHIVSLFGHLIAHPGTTESQAAASNRQFLSGLLLSIVRGRGATGGTFELIMRDILFVLLRFAYFADQSSRNVKDSSGASHNEGEEKEKHVRAAPKPAVTEGTQQLFRTRINSCLNTLIHNNKDPANLCYSLVRAIRDASTSMEYGKFIIEMGDTVRESVEGAFKSLRKLSRKARVPRGGCIYFTELMESRKNTVERTRIVPESKPSGCSTP